MTTEPRLADAPFGYEVFTHTRVVPTRPPTELFWHLGPVTTKTTTVQPGPPGSPATGDEDIIMQLTADQQVELSITGVDKYGNQVDISGDVAWMSSDESVVVIRQTKEADSAHATAQAVGPAGTAAVTVTNDVDRDGTGDFMGSIAIDVVAGEIAEIEISAGEPTDKA